MKDSIYLKSFPPCLGVTVCGLGDDGRGLVIKGKLHLGFDSRERCKR